jgi:hypothetical protein
MLGRFAIPPPFPYPPNTLSTTFFCRQKKPPEIIRIQDRILRAATEFMQILQRGFRELFFQLIHQVLLLRLILHVL